MTKYLPPSFALLSISLLCLNAPLIAESAISELNHWDQATRRGALQTIMENPQEFTEPAFVHRIALLSTNDPNCGVRTLAAETLNVLAENTEIASASEHLEKALADPIDTVRTAALETLCNEKVSFNFSTELSTTLQQDPARSVRIVARKCRKLSTLR